MRYLLRPLPIAEPQRVVQAYSGWQSNVRYEQYAGYRDQNRSMENLAEVSGAEISLRADGPPEHVRGFAITGNYFETIGVRAALGRTITHEDDNRAAPGVLMLSDAFWRRRFDGNPNAVGSQVFVNGIPYTIIGVAPPSFKGTLAFVVGQIYIPWNAPGFRAPRSGHLIGRLRPNISISQAQADLLAVAKQLNIEQSREIAITVYPATMLPGFIQGTVAAFMGLLLAVAGLVLLIACVNIASLLLARSTFRSREIAVRIALGASRKQLARQLLAENFLLSAAGGLAAKFVALATARAFLAIPIPADIELGLEFALDWRVGFFAAGISLVTTLLFGIIPAIQAVNADVAPALKEGAMTSGTGKSRLRAGFVVTQVALSTLLLVTAALLVRSLTGEQATNRHFDAQNVLTAAVNLENAGYTEERGKAFYENLIQGLEGTPGVVSATVVDIVPLALSDSGGIMYKEGDQPAPNSRGPGIRVSNNRVSPGFFKTLGIALLQGRDFTYQDRANAANATRVGIVNQTLAGRLWPGENPIGKRLHSGNNELIEVVGVAADSKYQWIGEDPTAFMYRPIMQQYTSVGTVLVKTTGDPLAAIPLLRTKVLTLDPNLPVYNVKTLEDAASISLWPVTIAASLAGILGMVALGLGAIGLYGVMSYLVRQRTREIGIRMALGANPSNVVQLMTRQGMTWTATGLVSGLIAALLLTRLMTGLLYGVGATDPIAFVAISVTLSATAFASCYVPARRASRIDPLAALREE